MATGAPPALCAAGRGVDLAEPPAEACSAFLSSQSPTGPPASCRTQAPARAVQAAVWPPPTARSRCFGSMAGAPGSTRAQVRRWTRRAIFVMGVVVAYGFAGLLWSSATESRGPGLRVSPSGYGVGLVLDSSCCGAGMRKTVLPGSRASRPTLAAPVTPASGDFAACPRSPRRAVLPRPTAASFLVVMLCVSAWRRPETGPAPAKLANESCALWRRFAPPNVLRSSPSFLRLPAGSRPGA